MLEQVNFVYPMEPGIYKVAALPEKKNNQPNGPTSFTDSLGYGFVYVGSEYKEPNKLYGNVIERSTYIWNNFVRNEASSGVLLTGQKGGGKMSRNSSLVRIPDGWEQIGNLKVGDTVVAVDGSYTRVKGVYPQGIKQLYRITFADGRTHDCGAEHLWDVYKIHTVTEDTYGNKLHTVSTTEMMSDLKANISLYIPLAEPERNTAKDFSIPPYEMGRKIDEDADDDAVTDANINTLNEYLNGSKEQRYELLQGLLSNGNENMDNKPIYYTTYSKELAKIIRTLVWSLGGMAFESHRLGGSRTTVYALRIELPNLSNPKHGLLPVLRVEEIDKDYATCIEVEHPSHLYVAEDYIVTHNTVMAKHLANIAISKGLKVFVIAEIRVDRKLISFISGLNNCVIFIDEFYKVIGWQFQDDFLSLMSDKNKKRLFILTENELSNINRFILDRPERIRYHYEYSTLDPNVIKEFCRDYNVPEDFKNKLLKLNMSNRNFSFDHLHALVTEAINSGKWDIEWLIEIMNVKSLKMKEIKRPIKVCAVDTPEIFVELEPSPIDQDLGVVKLGNSMLQANYLTWKKLRDNETIPEPLLANYNLTKEKIDKFEDKMLLLEKIEKQAGNLNVDGLLPGNRRRNYDFDNGQQQVTDTPTNIIKVNFSPEFMVGMGDEYSIYVDVTGNFKVYIETKKLIY